MSLAIRCLDLLFGKGDDDYPFWLLTVRLNVLLFVVCSALVLAWNLSPERRRKLVGVRGEIVLAVVLTTLAALLRFWVARPNVMDFGGIAYSRVLYGYRGYFATAQLFSLVYQLTTRDIEHAIFLDRAAGTLTIPLVYVLCRYLQQRTTRLPATAAFLFAVYPLHIVFSASDALAICSTFLAASSYVLLVSADDWAEPHIRQVHYLGAFAGLALLTQVRPENVLLLIPPVFVLLAGWHSFRVQDLARPLGVVALLLAIYGYQGATSGLSYQNPADIESSAELVIWHVGLNPFFAIPLLFAASLTVIAYRRIGFGLLALLPWVAVFILAVLTSQDGHGAARVFANWLILILPFAAYGLTLMLESSWRFARAVAAAALLFFGAQPLALHQMLATQHLEILENDVFKKLLAELPPDVKSIVVPDDELISRQPHSTLEVYRKYAMIWGGIPGASSRVRLVGLTQYLERPQEADCAAGTCAFFFGLPCTERDVYPQTGDQCQELLHTHRTEVLSEMTLNAAPFVDCSIYTGWQRALLCDPATHPRQFVVYRVDS